MPSPHAPLVARAGGRPDALAVVICRVENLDEITHAAGPAHAHRVNVHTAAVLRAHLRDFDVLGKTAPGDFTVVMPEPGAGAAAAGRPT